MKNVIKKISSVALAFTLLGTGTTVTNKFYANSNTVIIASAAKCNGHNNPYKRWSRWEKTGNREKDGWRTWVEWTRHESWFCTSCGAFLGTGQTDSVWTDGDVYPYWL